jgi:hypothetical protein
MILLSLASNEHEDYPQMTRIVADGIRKFVEDGALSLFHGFAQ